MNARERQTRPDPELIIREKQASDVHQEALEPPPERALDSQHRIWHLRQKNIEPAPISQPNNIRGYTEQFNKPLPTKPIHDSNH